MMRRRSLTGAVFFTCLPSPGSPYVPGLPYALRWRWAVCGRRWPRLSFARDLAGSAPWASRSTSPAAGAARSCRVRLGL